MADLWNRAAPLPPDPLWLAALAEAGGLEAGRLEAGPGVLTRSTLGEVGGSRRGFSLKLSSQVETPI